MRQWMRAEADFVSFLARNRCKPPVTQSQFRAWPARSACRSLPIIIAPGLRASPTSRHSWSSAARLARARHSWGITILQRRPNSALATSRTPAALVGWLYLISRRISGDYRRTCRNQLRRGQSLTGTAALAVATKRKITAAPG